MLASLVQSHCDTAALSIELKYLGIFSRELAFNVRIAGIVIDFAYG